MKIQDNFKKFLVKASILIAAVILTRAMFQFPVEYFGIELLRQSTANRLFSKIDALKVLSVVGFFFAFYYRRKISTIKHPVFNIKSSAIFVVIAELLVTSYYLLRAFTNHYSIVHGPVQWLAWLLIFLLLAAAFSCLAAAVFNLSYLRKFYSAFKRPLYVSAAATVLLYSTLMFFQSQWQVFSKLVSEIMFRILSEFYTVVLYFGNSAPVLGIGNFSIAIGPPCSGIDSMLLFTVFFAALFALDHARLKKGLYILFFALGFIGVYIVNILRLLLLILVGVHISPEFAVGMFHTQAGWLLFVIYFLCYYLLIKTFIYK